ncbi:MAG: Gfo/Idh/MocA family oxidoreductase [Verrucomicrobiae bacterium]|nr:Gfo/Idh/MocA family oxidoreductase [Verrucomicrobiae bacterium]
MKKQVRWGVIGAAGIADRRTIPEGILQASNARLVAVTDVNSARGRAVADKHRVPFCATDRELIGREDVDAVYLATPNVFHAPQAIAAMRKGKHVLCEKPLALAVREAEAMMREARRARVKLACGYMMRFHAAHRKIAELVGKGALGKMSLGRAQLTCWYPPIKGAWRQDPRQGGGGSFMDMGSHCVDLLEMFLGRVRRVRGATARRVHAYRSEDTSVVLLEFCSGALGMVDNQFNVPDVAARNRLELYGSLGSVLCEGTIGQGPGGTVTMYRESAEGGYVAAQKRPAQGGTALKYRPINTYLAEIEDFSDAILKNRKPLATAEEALWNLKVCLAVYRAARTGRAVEVF